MVGHGVGVLFGSVAAQIWPLSISQVGQAPESVAVRAGLTLIILLITLLLGPRIAGSVIRVPNIIETARERRAARLEGAAAANGAEGAEGAEHVPEGDAGEGENHGASRWLYWVVLVCIWIVALYLIGGIWFADTALTPIERKGLVTALHEFILNLGVSVLIIILTLIVARALQKSLVASLRRGRVNRNLLLLAGRTIFTATVLIGVVAILGIWGLGIALPVTLIGGITVALSFALQDILKNLVAGIYLLLERPFVIGDQITITTITPYTGIVENISIRVTALRTTSGERVLVPNGLLFSSAVVNNSFYQQRRVGMLVSVPDTEPDAMNNARKQILNVLEGLDIALRTPEPDVALVKVSEGKVDLRADFWLPVTRGDERDAALSGAMEQVRTRLPGAEVSPMYPSLAD